MLCYSAVAARVGKASAQAWAVQRGMALLTKPRSEAEARKDFGISTLPEDTLNEGQRLNEVVKTEIPGFIPQGS
jgi:hypothetical protein